MIEPAGIPQRHPIVVSFCGGRRRCPERDCGRHLNPGPRVRLAKISVLLRDSRISVVIHNHFPRILVQIATIKALVENRFSDFEKQVLLMPGFCRPELAKRRVQFSIVDILKLIVPERKLSSRLERNSASPP